MENETDVLSKSIALIMAGGKGTRLWPESTSKRPKQYLSIGSGDGLLTSSLKRLDTLVDVNNRFIITTKSQAGLVVEHCNNLIGKNGIIFEPLGRNTAPCILLSLAYLKSLKFSPSSTISILPSDHVILDTKSFQTKLKDAQEYAFRNSKIVTIGIKPHFPHIGFGYIQKGKQSNQENFYSVSSFKEKPDKETAIKYLQSGEYFWNSGMFISRFDVLVNEFLEHAPHLFDHFEELCRIYSQKNIDENKLKAVYESLEKISIDYAVMEKSRNIHLTPATFDWNDLGSWDALEGVVSRENDNYVLDSLECDFINSKDNIIHAPGKYIALRDVNDMVIVNNDKVLMILPKKSSQKVSKFVENIKSKNIREDLV